MEDFAEILLLYNFDIKYYIVDIPNSTGDHYMKIKFKKNSFYICEKGLRN